LLKTAWQKENFVHNEKQPAHRTLWIDFAKVIGIWLVIFGHMKLPVNLTNVIYSFHMPLFFFISGYLEKNRSIKENFLNSIKTLIVPYVLLYSLYYLWWFPVSLLRHPELFGKISIDNAIFKPILGMIFGVGYNTDFSIMIDTPLWFMVGLFFVKVIHNILYHFNNNKIVYIIVVFVIIGFSLFLKYREIDLLFSIDSALLAFPFFSMGNLLKKSNYMKILEERSKNIFSLLVAMGGYILLVVFVPFNGRIDIDDFNYGKNIIYFYLLGMVGICSTVFLSLLYRHSNKIVTIIAKGTVIVMAFHSISTGIIFRIIGLGGGGGGQ
jgi:fucose 4-O-acetylase-like acetyltransferase